MVLHRIAVAVSAMLLVLTLSVAAQAAPQFVRVSWDNADDSGTTLTLTWNTPAAAGSEIEYGTTASYGSTATGTSSTSVGPLGTIHVVQLSGLTPLTQYHYRVGSAGDWSADYTTSTGPPADDKGCETIRFIAMGDGRSDDDYGPATHWKTILAEAVAHNPQAIVLTGDQVRAGDEVSQWVHWLEETEGPAAQVPIMPSLGNHDDDSVEGGGAMYNQIFSVPTNSTTGTEDYYYFTVGDAIFVSLSMQTYKGGAVPYGDQAQWLDEVLTNNPKTWKFVYFHHPIYTGVLGIPGLLELNHPPNEKDQNAALVPIFDKHHVDIVFTGHNHHYQRYEPMCCGGGDDQGTEVGDFASGTVYVVTGGAGALTYDLSVLGIDLPGLLCSSLINPGSVKCDARHHYVKVEINGLDLNYQVWTTASQLLSNDSSNIKLIDEFNITKAGTAPDCTPPTPDAGPEAAPDQAADTAAEAIAEPIPDSTVADAGAGDAVLPPDGGAEVVADAASGDTSGTADTTASSDTAGKTDTAKAPDTAVAQDTATSPQPDGTGVPVTDTGVGGGPNLGDESDGCAVSSSGSQLPGLPALLLVVFGLALALRRRSA